MVMTVLSIDSGYGNEGKAREITLEVDFIPVYKAESVEIYSFKRVLTSLEWDVMTSAGTFTVDVVKLFYIENNHCRTKHLAFYDDCEKLIKKYCLRQCDPEEVDE